MSTQTAVFTCRVAEHMGPPPLVAAASDKCRDVIDRVVGTGASEIIVLDHVGHAVGIVTEQDMSRRMACRDCAA